MKMRPIQLPSVLWVLSGLLACSSCSSLQPTEEDPYQKTWEQRLQSEDWDQSLATPVRSTARPADAHYALPELDQIRDRNVPPEFVQAYPRLVSRAYFRLIAEALDADREIGATYQRTYLEAKKDSNKGDERIQQAYETAKRRYEAHRQMLEGLRSWRAFHKYGSDDLEFFLEEQLRASYALFRKGATEDRIIGHLMTQLADLYHKDGEGIYRAM